MTSIDVSRHVNTKKLSLKVKVLTPMFLGGADGHAELRPAPFKALLRYWWRTIKGEQDVQQLNFEEAKLFGGVTGTAQKSKVSISVKGAVNIKVPKSENLKKIFHREAERANCKVDGPGYLAGMGHYDFRSGFKKKAILPEQTFDLVIRYPQSNREDIETTLWMINKFAAVGARSRNGFGSFCFENFDYTGRKIMIKNFREVLKNHDKSYPHCLTSDEKGVTIWKLNDLNTINYEVLLRALAEIYIRLRTSEFFRFNGHGPGNRHLLGYPVMHHNFNEWGGPGGRLPSQLRFMVKPDGNNSFTGFILHIAHSLPENRQWFPQLSSQEEIWGKVHEFLDKNMTRVTI